MLFLAITSISLSPNGGVLAAADSGKIQSFLFGQQSYYLQSPLIDRRHGDSMLRSETCVNVFSSFKTHLSHYAEKRACLWPKWSKAGLDLSRNCLNTPVRKLSA